MLITEALSPWMAVRDDLDWDTCPEEIWEELQSQAPKLATLSQFWFVKGLERAITEMERTIDGKPFWPTRHDLIDHLKSIHAPH